MARFSIRLRKVMIKPAHCIFLTQFANRGAGSLSDLELVWKGTRTVGQLFFIYNESSVAVSKIV
jgi:hypothetical protein